MLAYKKRFGNNDVIRSAFIVFFMQSNNFWHSHKHSWIKGTVEKVHNQADVALQGGLLVRNYLFKFYAVVLCNAYMVLFILCSHCLMPNVLSLCREETKLGSHMNVQASIFLFFLLHFYEASLFPRQPARASYSLCAQDAAAGCNSSLKHARPLHTISCCTVDQSCRAVHVQDSAVNRTNSSGCVAFQLLLLPACCEWADLPHSPHTQAIFAFSFFFLCNAY